MRPLLIIVMDQSLRIATFLPQQEQTSATRLPDMIQKLLWLLSRREKIVQTSTGGNSASSRTQKCITLR
jgi:hypothetical protein